jgi:hypothetical protein
MTATSHLPLLNATVPAPNDYPRACLAKLVEHVFQHRNSLIRGLTYKDLALQIGYLNKHGDPHPRLGRPLGTMGRLLKGLEGKWGENIPCIQSLVVLKTGPLEGLPDDGMQEFWPDYKRWSRAEKASRSAIEYKLAVDFGSRWNDVLSALGLPAVAEPFSDADTKKPRGAMGESEAHKRLKLFVKDHPGIVGAGGDWEALLEYPLLSGDLVDVLFRSSNACIAVEVKSKVSDTFPSDYERGIYQVVKYDAVLRAMATVGCDIPVNVRSVLVTELSLPEHLRAKASKLNVQLHENVYSLEVLHSQTTCIPEQEITR